MKSKRVFDVWERHGYHVTPDHFYEPIPSSRDIERTLDRSWSMNGVDLREESQLDLLRHLGEWRGEFEQLDTDNRYFGSVDAEIYHGLIRSTRPARIYEIGSGFSTVVASHAASLNGGCEIRVFDPYPSPLLRELEVSVDARQLQDVPVAEFSSLGPGDILFIDSSHVVAPGSDVVLELLELVPSVAEGVLIHVHDIFLPQEYPSTWLRDQKYFWGEQYLLQAFLAFNTAFEVVWAGAYMASTHPDAMARAFDSFDPSRTKPGSFWFKRIRRG